MKAIAVIVDAEVAALRDGGLGTRRVKAPYLGEVRVLEFSRVATLFAPDLIPAEVLWDPHLICEEVEVAAAEFEPGTDSADGEPVDLDSADGAAGETSAAPPLVPRRTKKPVKRRHAKG